MLNFIRRYKAILLAVFIAALLWLLESWLDAAHEGNSLYHNIVNLSLHEFRLRLVAVMLIFLLGVGIHILLKKNRKAKKRTDHLNNVLKAIRNVNQLITWQKDRDKMVEEACNMLTETRGYRGAIIVLLDENMQVEKVEESGWEKKGENLKDQMKRGPLPECCKRALESKGVILIENTKESCTGCPLIEEENNSRALTTRLEQNGRIYGILSVNVPEDFAELKEEQELVKEIAGDLAFALHDIEIESQLKQSEKKYFTLFKAAKDAIFIASADTGIIVDVNRSAEILTGYDKKQLIGKHQLELHPEDQRKEAQDSFKDDTEKGNQANTKYFDVEHKSGKRIPVEINPQTIRIGGINYVYGVFRDISERVKAKKELEESRKFLSTTLESLPDMIMVIDKDRKVVLSNWKKHELHPVEKLSQYPYCYKVFKHRETPCNYCPPMDAFSDGKPRNFIDQNPIDGSYKEIFVSPIFDENKQVSHVMEYVEDITERKKAEEQIKESEEKYRSLIEQSRDAIFILSPRGEHVEVNYEAERLLKYSREELMGLTYMDVVDDQYAEDSQIKIKELNEGKRFSTYEKVFVTKYGKKIPVEITVSSVKNENNELKYILSIVRDISERKRTEESINDYIKELRIVSDVATELNQSNSIERTLQVIGEMAYMLNPDSQIILTYSDINNPDVIRIRDYYGFSGMVDRLIKIIGKDPRNSEFRVSEMTKEDRQIYTAGELLLLDNGIYQLMNGKISNNTANMIQKLLGVEKVYTMGFSHKTNPRGGIVIFIKKGEKLHKKNLLENMIKQAAVNLEHKAAEAALQVAKEKSEESDRLKTAFLANMSHEIRTPMNGIIGFSQVLMEKEFPRNKQKQFLEVIHSRSVHLLDVINDIIDISKIEAGQLNITYSNFYLNDTLNNLYNQYGFNLQNQDEKKIKLEHYWDLPRVESYITTDQVRLKQILGNLLNNAIKFTEKGKIEFGYEKSEDNLLKFYVKDTGIGIPRSQFEFIFDRFRQVDGSTTRNYEGTGLGLAISKNIAEALGGEIWLESSEGKGTIFYFTIPYNPVKNIGDKQPADNIDEFEWKDKTILLVEDDPASCSFFQEAFEPREVNLLVANNGKEGLELYEKQKSIDLILMDISLPDVDGIEVTKTIRKKDKEIPIIAQTAHAMGDDRSICLNAGCNDYITKPIDIKSLYSLIDNYFKQ